MIVPEGYVNETPLKFSDNRLSSSHETISRWIQELLQQGVGVGDVLIGIYNREDLKLTLKAVIPPVDGEGGHSGLIAWQISRRRDSKHAWKSDEALSIGVNLSALNLFRYKSEEELVKSDYKACLREYLIKTHPMVGHDVLDSVTEFTFRRYALEKLKDPDNEEAD